MIWEAVHNKGITQKCTSLNDDQLWLNIRQSSGVSQVKNVLPLNEIVISPLVGYGIFSLVMLQYSCKWQAKFWPVYYVVHVVEPVLGLSGNFSQDGKWKCTLIGTQNFMRLSLSF